MSIFDDIIGKNADDRLAEEMLYAEAMREIEQGIRRDGLKVYFLPLSESFKASSKSFEFF